MRASKIACPFARFHGRFIGAVVEPRGTALANARRENFLEYRLGCAGKRLDGHCARHVAHGPEAHD